MPRKPAKPIGTLRLNFRPGDTTADDLSVVERIGRCLFVAADEGAELVRLTTEDGTAYGMDAVFPLARFFRLPDPGDGEADIEGMTENDGWLWVVGSHALARKQPRKGEYDAQALDRLTEVRCDANRFLLGRIPLRTGPDGLCEPVPEDGSRRARCLKMKNGSSALAKALKKDEHLHRFMKVPAKENGFDIEGLAARGDRVFLGLRGPVLRGWACILELEVEEAPRRPERLKLRRIGRNGERYRKHFVNLDGLGIRELACDGDDLVILAGPTMDLDGPVAVWRWTDALAVVHETVVPADRLVRVLDLPFGEGCDHAEGIARIPRDGAPPALLVVYDSPSGNRKQGDGVDADLFALPPRLAL